MRLIGLPKEMAAYRPATLRYRLLNLAGSVTKTGRRLVLNRPWVGDLVAIYRACRSAIQGTLRRGAGASA